MSSSAQIINCFLYGFDLCFLGCDLCFFVGDLSSQGILLSLNLGLLLFQLCIVILFCSLFLVHYLSRCCCFVGFPCSDSCLIRCFFCSLCCLLCDLIAAGSGLVSILCLTYFCFCRCKCFFSLFQFLVCIFDTGFDICFRLCLCLIIGFLCCI